MSRFVVGTSLALLLTLAGALRAHAAPEGAAGRAAGGEASGGEGKAAGPTFSPPLPSPDLPAGVLTIKVVGAGMTDVRVGQVVTLQRLTGGKPGASESGKAGADGRARFEKLEAGSTYALAVRVGDQEVRSAPFPGPPSGGLRVLLSLGGAALGGSHPPLPGGAEEPPPASQPATDQLPPGHPPVGKRGPAPGPDKDAGVAELSADKELAPGELVVRVVKGAAKQPVAGVRVLIDGVSSAGPQPTDAQGKRTFKLPLPATGEPAVRAVVTVEHGGMSYRSGGIVAPQAGGLVATFTVYDRTRDPSKLALGPGTHIVCQPSEGTVNFMQVLNVVNRGDAIFDPGPDGLRLPLPRRATGLEIPEDQKRLLAGDAEQGLVRLIAPIAPGQVSLRLFYELPYSGSTLDFAQQLPLAIGESIAALINNESVRVIGPTVIKDEVADANGRKEHLYTLAAVSAGAVLEFSLDGLPHRDKLPVYIAFTIAGLLALWAIGGAITGPTRARRQEEQREHLLRELVQLQRSKLKGEQGAQQRKEVRSALRAVWEERW